MIADMNDEVGEKLVKTNDDGGEGGFYHVDVTKKMRFRHVSINVLMCLENRYVDQYCTVIMGVEDRIHHETTAEMFDKDVSINFKAYSCLQIYFAGVAQKCSCEFQCGICWQWG